MYMPKHDGEPCLRLPILRRFVGEPECAVGDGWKSWQMAWTLLEAQRGAVPHREMHPQLILPLKTVENDL